VSPSRPNGRGRRLFSLALGILVLSLTVRLGPGTDPSASALRQRVQALEQQVNDDYEAHDVVLEQPIEGVRRRLEELKKELGGTN